MQSGDHTQPKQRVIILCTGNSCRSQMAEAFWRKHGGDRWEVVSAGTRPKDQVYPLAVQAMSERGIDIGRQKPKDARQFVGEHFDLVITVCDNADRECPSFRNADKHIHHAFDDPPKFPGGDEVRMQVCRRVRDEIEAQVKQWIREETRPYAGLAGRASGEIGCEKGFSHQRN